MNQADYTVTINWGDGTAPSAGTVTGIGGVLTVTSAGGHVYTVDSIDAPNGAYSVTVTLVKAGQTAATVSHDVVVTRPPMAGQMSNVVEDTHGIVANQVIAAFEVPNITDTAGEFGATIDWGDGTTSAGVVSRSSRLCDMAEFDGRRSCRWQDHYYDHLQVVLQRRAIQCQVADGFDNCVQGYDKKMGEALK